MAASVANQAARAMDTAVDDAERLFKSASRWSSTERGRHAHGSDQSLPKKDAESTQHRSTFSKAYKEHARGFSKCSAI
ncbi:hypothetical protein OC846_004345 [Tilletia horrida]|uniref:Uncharacterized protein n=1 Tax=Tilletia horrida TaxID=155126 RepID=A0AAN6GNG0_9BASI|nr:hypothetical protein OC846_004345 [Tilletia horrida]